MYLPRRWLWILEPTRLICEAMAAAARRYPFEMTRHLEDLEELLDRYQIESCLVLGWSLGGIFAMELALRRPHTVRGLILIGTAARPHGSHPPISWQDNVVTGAAGPLNWALPGDPLAIALGRKSLFRYLIRQHTPEAYRYLAQRGAPAYLRTSRRAESALFSAIRAGYNRLPDIKTLQIPSLMLCGECDRHITAESSLETARALPDCQVHCYPDTAHLFPWEIPTVSQSRHSCLAGCPRDSLAVDMTEPGLFRFSELICRLSSPKPS